MSALKRVLVVDDDESIRAVVELALSDGGYEVAEAADGAAALTLIDKTAPDLILLDMQMPTMDGWAFAQVYHQRPGPHAPVIVLTAALDAAARAAEIQAEGYLGKPFELADLYACVKQYVSEE